MTPVLGQYFEPVPKIRSCLIPNINSQNSYDRHKKNLMTNPKITFEQS